MEVMEKNPSWPCLTNPTRYEMDKGDEVQKVLNKHTTVDFETKYSYSYSLMLEVYRRLEAVLFLAAYHL